MTTGASAKDNWHAENLNSSGSGADDFLLQIFGLRHSVLSVQMSVREEKEKQRRPFVSVVANCQLPVNTAARTSGCLVYSQR